MFKPVKIPPPDYRRVEEIDLSRQFGLLLGLNLAGLVWMAAAGWLFFILGRLRFPDIHPSITVSATGDLISGLLMIAGGFGAAIGLHELVHGVFFLIFTGERPRFGLSLAYAYAAAPDWFIPRNRYMVIGIAPLVLISLAGIIALTILPRPLFPLWWFCLIVNAGGAIGDAYVVIRLLLRPPAALINDHGDRIEIFAPAA